MRDYRRGGRIPPWRRRALAGRASRPTGYSAVNGSRPTATDDPRATTDGEPRIENGLVVNLALALIAAAVGAVVAVRVRLSPIVGYIAAGVLIGPYTPGLVGDVEIVRELADVGVVFLLFTIGARISLRDLARLGRLATVGGVSQVIVLIGAGYAAGLAIGLSDLEALFLGAVVSNSSSTVLAKVLGDRGQADTEYGHAALAWSTIQDLGTIILIVVLTALATSPDAVAQELPLAIVKAAAFLLLSLGLGSRVVPPLVEFLASFRSREIFLLGVVGIALGTAYAASLFGISLALGAFLAGLVIAESDLSYKVFGEALPFRDVFAGLFFVSTGMLVSPALLAGSLPAALVIIGLIVVVKGGVVAGLARVLGRSTPTSILIGATLAQSAEFSFLMARAGVDLGAVGGEAFSLMLGAAAASVVLSPAVVGVGQRVARRVEHRAVPDELRPPLAPTGRRRHAVLCGHGRVGRMVALALERRGFTVVVIEEDRGIVQELRARGVSTVRGSAANRIALETADLAHAAVLVIAVPDPLTVRLIAQEGRQIKPRIPIVARTHTARERTALRQLGVDEVVVGETELGLEMTRFALRHFGVGNPEAQAILAGLRRRA